MDIKHKQSKASDKLLHYILLPNFRHQKMKDKWRKHYFSNSISASLFRFTYLSRSWYIL